METVLSSRAVQSLSQLSEKEAAFCADCRHKEILHMIGAKPGCEVIRVTLERQAQHFREEGITPNTPAAVDHDYLVRTASWLNPNMMSYDCPRFRFNTRTGLVAPRHRS